MAEVDVVVLWFTVKADESVTQSAYASLAYIAKYMCQALYTSQLSAVAYPVRCLVPRRVKVSYIFQDTFWVYTYDVFSPSFGLIGCEAGVGSNWCCPDAVLDLRTCWNRCKEAF